MDIRLAREGKARVKLFKEKHVEVVQRFLVVRKWVPRQFKH